MYIFTVSLLTMLFVSIPTFYNPIFFSEVNSLKSLKSALDKLSFYLKISLLALFFSPDFEDNISFFLFWLPLLPGKCQPSVYSYVFGENLVFLTNVFQISMIYFSLLYFHINPLAVDFCTTFLGVIQ